MSPSEAEPSPASLPDGVALFRLLAEQAPAILWSTDRDLRFTSSLGSALRHLGLAPGQNVGVLVQDYYGTQDPEFPPIASHRRALAGEKSTYEFEWKGRVYHTRVEPFLGVDGAVIGTIGLALDITERKRAEAALRDSDERWKAVVSQAPDYILILDPQGRILYINRVQKSSTLEETIGSSTLDYLLPGYRDLARRAYARALETGQTVTYDVQALSLHGVLWFRNRVGPLQRGGKAANLILISTDITENKQAEAALEESLTRMRGLAARLQSVREEERKRISLDIHDRLGQALTGLKLDISTLAARMKPGQEDRRRVRAIFRSLDETIQTVREISTDLRPAVLDSLGLRAAIEWQAREFQSRTNIKLRLALPPGDIPLDTDRATALFRIFQEILTNVARHARARRIEVVLKEAEGAVILTVSDDGKGLSKKSLGEPHSLGLLGMRERALAFGGVVDIQGHRGKGTTVSVRLPLAAKKKRLGPPSRKGLASRGKR